jgi:hypothetical protein
MGKLIEVWVTKYALTQGIFHCPDAETSGDDMIRVRPTVPNAICSYYHKKDWHTSLEAAQEKAEQMRQKKLAALDRQIKKIKSLKF